SISHGCPINQIHESWNQPSKEKGLPWRFILLPLELALVFAVVWWVYTSMLTPVPVWQLNALVGTRWGSKSSEGGALTFGVDTYDKKAHLSNILTGKKEATFDIGALQVESDAYHAPSKTLALGM